MPEERKQIPVMTALGVLFTLIAVVALVALVQLRSKADTALQNATVVEEGPAIDSITAIDQSSNDIIGGFLVPNEGQTNTVTVTATVSDPNGCKDIENVYMKVSRSDYLSTCNVDHEAQVQCYVGSVAKAALTDCSVGGDTTAIATFTVPMANFADPTDTGSPEGALGHHWTISIEATDSASQSKVDTRTFDVASLAAFSTLSSINYGSVSLGQVSDVQTLPFSNTGNRLVDADVLAYHTDAPWVPEYPPVDGDMHSSLGASYSIIPAAKVHYALTDNFTYNDTPASGEAAVSKTTAQTFAIQLPQQRLDGAQNIPVVNTYWKLKMPASGVSGQYQNTLVFTAKPYASEVVDAPLSQKSSTDYTAVGGVYQSTVDGDTAYLASYSNDELTSVNVSNKESTTIISSVNNTVSNVTDIEKSANDVYLTSSNSTNNFQVIDVTNSASMSIVSTSNIMSGGIADMAVSNGYAYVVGTDSTNNFKVVDLSNLSSPTVVGGINLDYSPTQVKVSGSKVYVYGVLAAAGYGYVTVIDVTTKASPSVIGSSFQTYPSGKFDISADGSRGYLAGNNSDFANTLQVIELSKPSNGIAALGSISINNNKVVSVVASGNYVYVTDSGSHVGTKNVNAVDVSNAEDPTVVASTNVGTYSSDGTTYNATVAGNYVYLAGVTDSKYYILNNATVSSGPVITALNGQNVATALVVPQNNGGSSFNLTITGTGFVEGDTVTWGLSSAPPSPAVVSYVSPTEITVTGIPSTAFAETGKIDVAVRNSLLEQTSNVAQISVLAY